MNRPGASIRGSLRSSYTCGKSSQVKQSNYTDGDGYKAIGSQADWVFKVEQPPGDHPPGAYFTSLGPEVKDLARRLRIPRGKLEFVFGFVAAGDVKPLRGRRGEVIFYSPVDYVVPCARQLFMGPREPAVEKSK